MNWRHLEGFWTRSNNGREKGLNDDDDEIVTNTKLKLKLQFQMSYQNNLILSY